MYRANTSRSRRPSCRVDWSKGLVIPGVVLLAFAAIGCDSVPSDVLSEAGSARSSAEAEASALANVAFETVQADQSKINLVFRGDEHFHWYEDFDGFTVVLNSGEYFYADIDENGELIATQWLVGEVDPYAVELTLGILPPQEVIDQLMEVCRNALKDPAFIEYYEKMKLIPSLKTVTVDLGGGSSTEEMGDAICRKL